MPASTSKSRGSPVLRHVHQMWPLGVIGFASRSLDNIHARVDQCVFVRKLQPRNLTITSEAWINEKEPALVDSVPTETGMPACSFMGFQHGYR